MKKLATTIIILAVLIVTCSCAPKNTGPTSTDISSAYYGSYPENYKEIITGFHSNTLFDPYSAKYNFGVPEKGWMWVKKRTSLGMDFDNNTIIGWAVIYEINAKNRYGAYTGASRFKAIIVDGKVQYASPITEQLFAF